MMSVRNGTTKEGKCWRQKGVVGRMSGSLDLDFFQKIMA